MNKRHGAIGHAVALVAVVAAVAAVAAPATSAKSGSQVKLSMLPLRKSALGPAAETLRLERYSGLVSNNAAAYRGQPLTPNHSLFTGLGLTKGIPEGTVFDKLGRISGYGLDYGLAESGGSGVTEIWTSVDQYRTSDQAKQGLSYWRRADRRIGSKPLGRLDITNKAENVAPVGTRRFAFLVRYRAANIAPLFGFDEQFTQGRYEGEVTVWASRAGKAEKLAPILAGRLEARIKSALAGRLYARPVKLPGRQQAGRPPGGPDLSSLGLTPTDLGVQASNWQHTYGLVTPDPFALSYYMDLMAGPFGGCYQYIYWFATANQANFVADAAAGRFDGASPVDLSSIGDGAEGVLANGQSGGNAQLLFLSGRLLEGIDFYRYSAISASDVQNLARTVANRINAAGLGSHARRITGGKIAYLADTHGVADMGGSWGDIWVMNPNGSHQHQITSGASWYGTAWSPDGTRIATMDLPSRTIYTINAKDGSDPQAVHPGGLQFVPGWQPLGASTEADDG